ncbi:phage head closure protein [Stutzerimonas nitrititolerans]|uniref:phage head closure protein n=1 Tax=Stutzerimonas nitrititolerans TaxID=2482751 RepID=UPI0028ABD98D|nr:phage head closure protein [Stutzerimonas nitrititolerans]
MRAGKLRHRIQLQQQVQVQDSETGAVALAWQDWPAPGRKLWASIEPLSARDFIAAQAAQSEVSARIVLRYRVGVLASMRALYRAKVYAIHGVLPDPDSGIEYLTLPVSEGVKDG